MTQLRVHRKILSLFTLLSLATSCNENKDTGLLDGIKTTSQLEADAQAAGNGQGVSTAPPNEGAAPAQEKQDPNFVNNALNNIQSGQSPWLSGAASGGSGGSGGCSSESDFIDKAEAAFFEATNQVRSASSLGPLTKEDKVAYAARDWSQKQSKSGNISHMGFPSARVQAVSAKFPNEAAPRLTAENVAMQSCVSNAASLGKTFADMLARSPGHLRNMLGSHTFLGVGIACNGNKCYATHIFAQ